MKFLALIPARYESSRFPGKPLAKIGGKEMIVRVCERVSRAGVECAVATDDERIYECVKNAGFNAVMTSAECGSGTERVAEAYAALGSDADVVINVQGDEPFIHPEQIESLKSIFINDPSTEIATLARKFDKNLGFEALFDSNLVKVVFSDMNEALYFSRSIIPYVRKAEWKNWLDETEFYAHVGIYAYKAPVLQRIVTLPVSTLEKAECLEQLRWLQNGYRIKVGITEHQTIGIDTPADLEAAEKSLGIFDIC